MSELPAVATYRLRNGSVRGVWHQAPPCITGSFGRLKLIRVLAEIDGLSPAADCRPPLASLCVPRDASVLGRRATLPRAVLGILSGWQDTEIGPPAVQAIPVDVIALSQVAMLQAQQFSVKLECHFMTSPTANALAPLRVARDQAPCPPSGKFSIGGIDDSVRAHVAEAISERDTSGQPILADLERRRIAIDDTTAALRAVVPFAPLGRFSIKGSSARWTNQIDPRANPTRLRTVAPRPGLVWSNEKTCSTPFTDARDGTLRLHHDLPKSTRGVGPVRVASTFGASCINYITSLRADRQAFELEVA